MQAPSFLHRSHHTVLNQAYCDYFGRGRDALLKTNFFELIPEGERSLVEASLAKCSPKHPFNTLLHSVRRADGEVRWVQWTNQAIWDEHCVLIELQSIGRDVTTQRQIAAALRASEKRFRQLFNAMDSGFALHELIVDNRGQPCDFRFLEVNPACERLTGLNGSALVGRAASEVLPGLEPVWFENYTQVAMTGQPIHFEEYTKTLDKTFDVHTYCPQKGQFACAFSDITERKQMQAAREAEAALRESERRFRIMADELPLIVWVQEPSGPSLSFVNKTCCTYFGKTQEQLIGDGWRDILHPDDRGRYVDSFLTSVREGKPFHDECLVRRADGQWRWLESFAPPIRNADGTFGEIVGTSLDITERKAADDALRASHQELERRAEQLGRLTSELTMAEQRERERLAKVLHDHLQQLLVGMTFGLDRIGRRLGTAAFENDAQQALANVKDVLDQAIATTRTLVADLSPPILYDSGLADALEWLARTMRERHGLTVMLKCEGDASPARKDVRSLVFESVREALFNVVKHAQCERAEVTLTQHEQRQLRVVIEDRGIGFDLARLAPAQTDGTGFGILAMRERLRFLGGRCTIDSEPDVGTRVTLIAPLGTEIEREPIQPQTSPQPPAAPTEMIGDAGPVLAIRVLLVDDHAMVRLGLKALLDEEPDLEVVGEASDGVDALEQVERLNPQLVLMDYSMPRMDGLEATRHIRQRWPQVRVIGLSMYREADRAAAMLDAGASAYVDKTAGADALLATIRSDAVAKSGA